jgi:hypothetical protein
MIQMEVSQAMRIGSGRWVEVTPSRFPHERAGLEHVRALFPDHEPYRAWTNLEIITDRGRSLEVDLLVLGPGGLYLIELKGWNGRITGDRYTWQVHRRGTQTFTNPWRLANDKARVLKGMLVEAARRRGQRRGRAGARPEVPYVQAAVFLHGLDVRCQLPSRERTSLYGLEGATARTHLPGIISGLIAKTPGNPDHVVTVEQAESISQLLSDLGMTRRRRRTVGPYELDENLYAEGQGWQDFLASHRRFPDERVRVRIYYTGQATTSEARAQLTRAAEREYRLLRFMNHPGLVAPQSFDETDAGPAVTYPSEPEALRLDHLLAAQLVTFFMIVFWRLPWMERLVSRMVETRSRSDSVHSVARSTWS